MAYGPLVPSGVVTAMIVILLLLFFYHSHTGDSFYYQNNAQFSTYDNDHDTNMFKHCAGIYKAGWWYTSCHFANLNGEYGNDNQLEGINWLTWTGVSYSMKEARMMLRRP